MTYDSFFAEREAPPAARRLSDAGWAGLRQAFADGASAPQLAERYGVSVSAIRTRARAEGWRRSDLPDAAEDAAEDEAALLADACAPAELRPLAWARACRAVRRGRLAEALGWTRLARQLDALAEREAASPARQARAAETLARAADTLAAARRAVTAIAPPPPSVLPLERGSSWSVEADDGWRDAAAGVVEVDPDDGGAPAVAGLRPPPPPPRAGEDEDLHDLHHLHGRATPVQGVPAPVQPPDWARAALGMR